MNMPGANAPREHLRGRRRLVGHSTPRMAKRGHLSANELRSDFDVEPQEAAPFSDTFHNNLLLTAPQAIFAQVVQEAKEE